CTAWLRGTDPSLRGRDFALGPLWPRGFRQVHRLEPAPPGRWRCVQGAAREAGSSGPWVGAVVNERKHPQRVQQAEIQLDSRPRAAGSDFGPSLGGYDFTGRPETLTSPGLAAL